MANFDLAFEKTLSLEGGYLIHEVAGDRGGMTFAGISRNNWPDWTGWQLIDGGETSGIRLEAMVRTFFKSHFWDVIKGDQIGFQGVADAIYDFAVNSGLSPAVKRVQKIVGANQDGIFGPKTFAKLNAFVTDERAEELFIARYNLLRIFRFKDICMEDERTQTNEATQCVIKLKQDVSSLFERVRAIERDQKESSQEIKEVHNNLNSINISLAELKSMLNSKIEKIIVRADK